MIARLRALLARRKTRPNATDRERISSRWLRSDPFPQYSHLDRADGRGDNDPRTK